MKTECDTATRKRKPATVVQRYAAQVRPSLRRDTARPAMLLPTRSILGDERGIEPVQLVLHNPDQPCSIGNNTAWRQGGADPGLLCLLPQGKDILIEAGQIGGAVAKP